MQNDVIQTKYTWYDYIWKTKALEKRYNVFTIILKVVDAT